MSGITLDIMNYSLIFFSLFLSSVLGFFVFCFLAT